MRKLPAAAALILPLIGAIGVGIAVAASGLSQTIVASRAASPLLLHEADNYLPGIRHALGDARS